jgi:putative transposase
MGKSRFTETQIISILKEVEKGRAVKDGCRQYSLSDATNYQWKPKYSGMEASYIRKLRELRR